MGLLRCARNDKTPCHCERSEATPHEEFHTRNLYIFNIRICSMTDSGITNKLGYRGLTSRALAKAIFDAEVPETVLQSLPPQSLFMVVKENGLASSIDLLSIATLDQCRTLLDLDLWREHTFNEETFWEWLEVTDAGQDLEFLQKLLKCVDLKLIGLMLGKYVEVLTYPEAADQPPGQGFYTPDGGSTWLNLTTLEGDKHFLMARLLALIFETSRELFYQLLSIASVATPSMLEEDSYQERLKRLASDGIPEMEVTAEVHASYSLAAALAELGSIGKTVLFADQVVVEPLIYEQRPVGYMAALLDAADDREVVEGELTFVLNAAIVFFGVDYTDQTEVLKLAEQVKGAINLGAQKLFENRPFDPKSVIQTLGITKLYRLGLAYLFDLRKKANRIDIEKAKSIAADPQLFSVLAHAREKFPCMPQFLSDSGEVEAAEEPGKVDPNSRPIESVKGLQLVTEILEKIAHT